MHFHTRGYALIYSCTSVCIHISIHATRAILQRLDNVQSKFLSNVGADEVIALAEFHLAPVAVRCDIAMLGLIHRTMLGKGPSQFSEHFKPGGQKRVCDPRVNCDSPLIRRSALGLVSVYNMLPPSVLSAKSVKQFRSELQVIVCKYAQNGYPLWKEMLSPRQASATHPLVSLFVSCRCSFHSKCD